jgi:hypothetical protein
MKYADLARKSWTERPYLNSAVALLAICGATIVPFSVVDGLDAVIRSAAVAYVLATVAPWWGKQEV